MQVVKYQKKSTDTYNYHKQWFFRIIAIPEKYIRRQHLFSNPCRYSCCCIWFIYAPQNTPTPNIEECRWNASSNQQIDCSFLPLLLHFLFNAFCCIICVPHHFISNVQPNMPNFILLSKYVFIDFYLFLLLLKQDWAYLLLAEAIIKDH